MEKSCARCQQPFTAPEADPFITCPSCRNPLTKKNLGKAKRMRTRQNRGEFEPSPWQENNIRHLEGD